MTLTDETMFEALFLHQHPGWTHQDFLDAPDQLVMTMHELSTKLAEAAKREADA